MENLVYPSLQSVKRINHGRYTFMYSVWFVSVAEENPKVGMRKICTRGWNMITQRIVTPSPQLYTTTSPQWLELIYASVRASACSPTLATDRIKTLMFCQCCLPCVLSRTLSSTSLYFFPIQGNSFLSSWQSVWKDWARYLEAYNYSVAGRV